MNARRTFELGLSSGHFNDRFLECQTFLIAHTYTPYLSPRFRLLIITRAYR